MATKKQFLKRCEELNITVQDDGQVMTIDPPQGKVFATFFTHYEAIFYDHQSMTKAECYADFIEIMKDGLVDCEVTECESCKVEMA